MNSIFKTIYRQFQKKRCAGFSLSVSQFPGALFGFRGHLIKLNYVIFSCAGKLRKNRSAIDIINFIKRLTSASDIPYLALAYGKDFSLFCFYYSIVRFAYGKDFFFNATASFLHLISRLFTGKQDTILTTNSTFSINPYISLFIAVAKGSKLAPLLPLLSFNWLTVPFTRLIFVAISIHKLFFATDILTTFSRFFTIGKGEFI